MLYAISRATIAVCICIAIYSVFFPFIVPSITNGFNKIYCGTEKANTEELFGATAGKEYLFEEKKL